MSALCEYTLFLLYEKGSFAIEQRSLLKIRVRKVGYPFLISGILQASSAVFPQTVHSPTSLFSIGLLLAQVPLNSLPVTMWRILIIMKPIPKAAKIRPNIFMNSIIQFFIKNQNWYCTFTFSFSHFPKGKNNLRKGDNKTLLKATMFFYYCSRLICETSFRKITIIIWQPHNSIRFKIKWMPSRVC